MSTFLSRAPRRESGQSVVEFALVFPLFLLLMFGLLDLGRLVYVNNAVSEGAREGSRWGSVASRARTSDTRVTIGSRTASTMAAVPNPTITATCQRGGTTVSTCRSGDMLVVEVRSRVDMMTPVIGQLVGAVTVSATSRVMVNQ